eukprot:s485_g27.t1
MLRICRSRCSTGARLGLSGAEAVASGATELLNYSRSSCHNRQQLRFIAAKYNASFIACFPTWISRRGLL